MKIFIISLRGATERRAFQSEQTTRLDLDVDFLDAVEARDLSDADCQKAGENWPGGSFRQDIACFHSHRLAWQRVVELDRPTMIIEDDAILADTLPQVLRRIEAEGAQPNVAYDLEFTPERHILATKPFWAAPEIGIVSRRVYRNRIGLAAYVIGPDAARRMLADTGRYVLIDSYFWHRPWLNAQQIEPAQALQMRFLDTATDASDFVRPPVDTLFRTRSRLRKWWLRLRLESTRLRCLILAAYRSEKRMPLIDLARFSPPGRAPQGREPTASMH